MFPQVQDGDFSEKRFQDLVNATLVNDVGNCLNRTLGLLHKNCSGQLPGDAACNLPHHIAHPFLSCLHSLMQQA